jgi:hypothetical protein
MRMVGYKKRIGVVAGAILAATATAAFAPSAYAQAVVPPQSEAFPQTYGEWAGRWVQYVYGLPAGQSPLDDATGAQCQFGQSGPVFFLVGTGGGSLTRSLCKVPADAGLFFPIVDIFCAVPDDGATRAEVITACSTDIIDKVDLKSLALEIDKKSVQNLSKYRASGFFPFTGAVPGSAATSCTGAPFPHCYESFRNDAYADGYWAMLRPLSVGQHTIHFHAAIPDFSFVLDVTYNLTVVPE